MAIKIVMESSCDIPKERAKRLGITVIPMKFTFPGGESYLDNVSMTHAEFYGKLENSEDIPVTSMVSPAEYEDVFRALSANGDSVIVVSLSSKLSGCYNSAVMARRDFENVYVVDSENACVGQSVLGEYRAKLAKNESDAKAVVEKLEKAKKRIRLLAVVDTLKYLKKGGRISSAAAFAGGLLGIKPVLTVDEGVIAVVGKARGAKAADNLLVKYIEDGNGIDETMPIYLGYSGSSRDTLDNYIENSRHIYADVDNIPVITIGCVIGTHVGPGAFGLAYFEKEK